MRPCPDTDHKFEHLHCSHVNGWHCSQNLPLAVVDLTWHATKCLISVTPAYVCDRRVGLQQVMSWCVHCFVDIRMRCTNLAQNLVAPSGPQVHKVSCKFLLCVAVWSCCIFTHAQPQALVGAQLLSMLVQCMYNAGECVRNSIAMSQLPIPADRDAACSKEPATRLLLQIAQLSDCA